MAPPRPQTALLAVAAVLLAALSLAATASTVAMRKEPAAALRLWPGNGIAAARLADQAMQAGIVLREKDREQAVPMMAKATALAHRSLETLALNPKALRVIALAEEEGRPRQYPILEQAARLSRRDSFTQLWLINRAAMEGDSRQTLDHYDALLRRRTPFRDLAGRTLAHALSEPQIVDGVAELLRRDPPWKTLLYHYAVRDPAAWDGFLELHRVLEGDAGVPIETSAQFAAGLAAAGRLDDAATVARLAGAKPLDRARGLTDARFAAGSPFPGNWIVADPASASLQPLAEGGALLSLARGRTGMVARRLVSLEPGTYRAELAVEPQASAGRPGAATVEPEARLACAGDRIDALGSTTLAVGSRCRFQWLSIVLPEAPPFESEIYLRAVKVTRGG